MAERYGTSTTPPAVPLAAVWTRTQRDRGQHIGTDLDPVGPGASAREGRAMLVCSSEDCCNEAVESLAMRDQPGHVHGCAVHAHDVREFCDVVKSVALTNGECPWSGCTGNVWLYHADPTPL